MSKQIAYVPLSSIDKLEIRVTNCKKSMAQVKYESGADYVLNGGMWTWSTNIACPHLVVDGRRISSDPKPTWWDSFGYSWDVGPDISLESSATAIGKSKNFISCSCLIGPWGPVEKISYSAKGQGGVAGRSAIGLKDGTLCLYCSSDNSKDAKTPEQLRDELHSLGWDSAVMLDGGGSSQCNFNGQTIKSDRYVHNWICVFKKKDADNQPTKEDQHMKKVCLDPGHGPGCVNGSPDGSYKEDKFAWDLCSRVKLLLEKYSDVSVVLTRGESGYPSLTDRATVSNNNNVDAFVSVHSNATGSGGWNDASGLMIYTSQGPMSADRNVLAADLIAQFKAAGVSVRENPILHEGYTVLVKTNAPAVLIEYGFHTNKTDVEKLNNDTYRDTLADATAKGICQFLNVEYKKQPDTTQPTDSNKPSEWAEASWEKAVKLGIFDGTNPLNPLTREQAASVLDRLGLLD